MTSTRSPQWVNVHKRVASALHMALDPEDTHGQRVQRMLDGASAHGAVNVALADALEEWNATHPDPLLRLPTELTHAIFRLLEFRARIIVSLVSRGWRATALGDPFLWNVANFSVDPSRKWNPLVYYPPPGRPNWKPPPRPPPPRKADILRELLARSDPAPFSLLWENQEPAQLPDEMAELVLQNMHRMEELTADLSPRAVERLFVHLAPVLRTLSCKAASGPCELPARWDAPALSELALAIVRIPADMQPLATVEVLFCDELQYLGKDLRD